MPNPTNVEPMIKPDQDQILAHLTHMFGGDLGGFHDGLIELAWTDAKDKRLRHAELYGTDQLEEMADRACEINLVPNQNIYFGVALRHPNTAPFGRCKDEDFYALPGFYVDIDDNVGQQAANLCQLRGCRPTARVVTGQVPTPRMQLFWRLEIPETDPEICRRQNKALADALGGDPTVVNPSRVMRLGGGIAWPNKPGRELELTSFKRYVDDRAAAYIEGQVDNAFPSADKATTTTDSPPIGDDEAPSSSAPPSADDKTPVTLNIGSEFDGVTVSTCMAEIRAGRLWHNNLLKLTGHWISHGLSDAEILATAEHFTLAGYTVDQTRDEMVTMIRGGRAKWNVPNAEHEVEQAMHHPPALVPAFVENLNIAMLPRRRWLLAQSLLRGNVSVNVAPPGVGKSTLAIEQAVAIVTGHPITGQKVYEQVKVWVCNNEDDGDELKRRLAAVLQHWGIPLDEVAGRLALNSGADRPVLFAKADRAGNVIRLPDVNACIEQIQSEKIGLFVVDPFIEVHEVNENSNEQIKAVAVMLREIARKADCAVMLIHHTAKPPLAASDGYAGNMNTARGASALTGVARIVQTLYSMSAKDAERYGVSDEDRHLYVRLDDAKANVGLITNKARWFRRMGVTIANGDEVGILVPENLELGIGDGSDDELHRTIIACLLARVSDPEITLNAAARLLAWCGDERFAKYRETDDKGHQRASKPIRTAILAACRRGICVVIGSKSQGFTCDEQRTPTTLKRFEMSASAAEIASQEPNFKEDA